MTTAVHTARRSICFDCGRLRNIADSVQQLCAKCAVDRGLRGRDWDGTETVLSLGYRDREAYCVTCGESQTWTESCRCPRCNGILLA